MFLVNKIAVISFVIFISVTLITGCQTAGTKKGSSAAITDNKVYSAQLGLTPRQRFSKALQYLEHGQVGQAAAELKAYLAVIPNSKRAKGLLEQTDMDPDVYFPKQNFSVKLTSGESLSTLAKKYLGSALKFYALAKYNNISNPSRVNIGQTIKIPLTQEAVIARNNDSKPKSVTKPPSPKVADTKKITPKNTIKQNITAQETKKIVNASTLTKDIANLTKKKDYKAAIVKISELKKLGDLNQESRNIALKAYLAYAEQLIPTNKVKAAENLILVADFHQFNGDSFAAFSTFKRASDLDPANARALEEMLVLQKDITDKYHREATVAKNNQDLPTAINKWDMVLKVDPEHASATLERSRAIQLQKKLAKIKK